MITLYGCLLIAGYLWARWCEKDSYNIQDEIQREIEEWDEKSKK
jgi:hypothetical protein